MNELREETSPKDELQKKSVNVCQTPTSETAAAAQREKKVCDFTANVYQAKH